MKASKFNNFAVAINLKNYSFVKVFYISAILSISLISCVKSIVIPEFREYFEDYGDRDLIIREIQEPARVREISRMIPCLLSFIETYLNLQTSRIPVLLPANATDFLEITQLLLSALQRIRSTFVFSGTLDHFDASSHQMTTLSGLIIIENSTEMTNMNSQLMNLCGRDCKYLVILTLIFPDKETFLEDSERLVQLLWFRHIANVVFFGVVGRTALISRSLSFKAHITTEPSAPVLVAECFEDSSDSKWFAASQIFSPLKMNKSIVHVGYFDHEPYVTMNRALSNDAISDEGSVVNDKGNFSSDIGDRATALKRKVIISRLEGIEGDIINTLASSLNFVIAEEEISSVTGSTATDTIREALWGEKTKNVDMVLGGLAWAPEEETDYTLPYAVVPTVWLVPIRPNVSLEGLIAPLDANVWLAVLGLLVFASCVELIMTRNVSFLEILSLVIGVAWPNQPTILSARIRFISWVIFGYMLTQFYLASLAGQLVASSDVQIDTLKQLADSSFAIGGLSSVKTLFNQTDGSDEENEKVGDPHADEINYIMGQKFQVFNREEYRKRFHDLIQKKNTSLALAVRMNISSMKPSFLGKSAHRMREALTTYPLSFAVWRGMPYLNVVDKKISNLIEGGIVSWWARKLSMIQEGYYDTNMHDGDDNGSNLDLEALIPGFLLLIMGYGFAGISLVIEIAVFSWRNRSVKKLTGKKLKRNIKQGKSILRISADLKKNERTGQKKIEPFDTRAWIVGFHNRHGHGRQSRSYVTRRVNFDFDH